MKHFTQNKLVVILLAGFITACSSAPAKRTANELPADAKLFIKKPGHDQLGAMSEACAGFSLSEAQVREIFKNLPQSFKVRVETKICGSPLLC